MRQIIALLTFLAAVVTLATLTSSAPMPHPPDLDRRDSVRITGGDKKTPKEGVLVYKRDSVRITGEDKKTPKEGD
ncbi:hypothetical protein BGZ75_002129 [Mortierella antarctica]|nr:hypothetical protein BGZ75_002129 [Mortierella antarctica]